MLELPFDKKIILFDGVCNLCNTAVQFVINKDEKDVFRFVSLQSETGIEIQKNLGLNTLQLESIILYEPGIAYYIKSQAAFQIAKHLTGPIRLIGILSPISGKLTDFCYDYIAQNRYKWYGKQEQCWIPTPELKSKFL